MKHHNISRIVIGSSFSIGKRTSRVTVEYHLVIDVVAAKTQTGRREYIDMKVGFTADSVDLAATQAYDHAEKTVAALLPGILKEVSGAVADDPQEA